MKKTYPKRHDSTEAHAKQGRPKPPARWDHPDEPSFKLPQNVIEAWEKTILHLGRIRMEPGRPRPDDNRVLQMIALQEREEVKRLWQSFTSQRDELPDMALNQKRRLVAYLLGFHLANSARAYAAMRRLEERHSDFWKTMALWNGPIHIIDLGCGTGAMSVVFLSRMMGQRGCDASRVHIHLCDRNGALLDTAEYAHSVLGHKARILRHRGGLDEYLSRLPSPASQKESSLDVFLSGYVWNELSGSERTRRLMIQAFESRARHNVPAINVILEPANQTPCRSAMELREVLCLQGWNALYPCPASTPCPMLNRPRDWCYSEVAWNRPPLQHSIDQWLGVDRSRLASSMLVFGTPSFCENLAPSTEQKPVVVGRPQKESRQRPSARDATAAKKDYVYLVCDGESLAQKPHKVGAPKLARGRSLA